MTRAISSKVYNSLPFLCQNEVSLTGSERNSVLSYASVKLLDKDKTRSLVEVTQKRKLKKKDIQSAMSRQVPVAMLVY